MYDPRRVGYLGSTGIWALLSAMPEGECRLEEDVLAIVKLAAAKADAGVPARVTLEEYVNGLSGDGGGGSGGGGWRTGWRTGGGCHRGRSGGGGGDGD